MAKFSYDLNGKPLVIETGKLARQASGSVLISHGDTVLLVAATVSDAPREGIDFFPLTVDYEERLYAVGRIPGGFIKREGRPTDKAVLAARLTDRPLRPLFPKKFRNAVHIVSTILSVDQDCPSEPLSILGASAALSISKIPFDGPVGAVVVGLEDGKPVISPRLSQKDNSPLYMTLAGKEDAIMMIEAEADEISEELMLECIAAGHEEIKKMVALQKEIVESCGVAKLEVVIPAGISDEIQTEMRAKITDNINEALTIPEKQTREERLDTIKKDLTEEYGEVFPEKDKLVAEVFENTLKELVRKQILEKGIRPDGRRPGEIRPITCEVGLLPRTHGSAVFTRGQTQVLNICTLGALRDMQILDGLGVEESKRFIHHYNFPPYSVGETGFMRGPGRREIGHGALAEKAVEKVIPDQDDFPYTIRLVSEVVESNGSTSMGSVCASSLALMDAGVTVKKTVSGIAMGLIKEKDQAVVLSDIQGMEDFLGDMDFKVAGTRDGINALQMDIKISGITIDIMKEALDSARKGYLHIMDVMEETISAPRTEMSPHAPRIITTQISVDKIRDVVGPGGRMINKIIGDTGVNIDIEPDGKIYILALDKDAGAKALKMIEGLVEEVEPGKNYLGKVTRIEKYGAFVEIMPGKDGLVHISQLDYNRVENTEDVVNIGDEVLVKVIGVDERGRIDLSRKDTMEKPPGYVERDRDKSRSNRGGGSGSRDRDRKKPFHGKGNR